MIQSKRTSEEEKDLARSFGDWMRARRRALDLTQDQLAQRAGCARVTIHKIETDERIPSKQLAEILAEKLGVLPPERAAFVRYARGGKYPESISVQSSDAVAWGNETRRHNVPACMTSFIGRAREIAQVKALLSQNRLVTLTGAGGVGKTRLALQIAEEMVDAECFSDGVWFVEFGSLQDATLVPQTVASVFDLHEISQSPLVDLLQNYCHAKNLLLVLDNCEHLIQACAQLCDRLLRACPHLKILATSREALNIVGEIKFRVPSLSLPSAQDLSSFANLRENESVRLFAERAAAATSGLMLTDEHVAGIAQICQRLNGIPLAIELASSRANVLSVKEIGERLDDCFRILIGGSRTALPRHQTLRATIAWSYNLLSTQEQVLFRRLAVFSGGWALDAAEAVCSGDGVEAQSVLPLLSHLIDKSLVIAEERDGETRYRMLETIRQYARGKLMDANEGERLRDQHLEFFLALAESAKPKLEGAEQLVWLARLQTEIDNLRAAIEWATKCGKADVGLRLMNALQLFLFQQMYFSEGKERLTRLLARPEASARTATRAASLANNGQFSIFLGMFDAASELIEEAIVVARDLEERQVIAFALLQKGVIQSYFGDTVTALKNLEESLILLRELDNKFGIMRTLSSLGGSVRDRGITQLWRGYVEEGLAISRELGNELFRIELTDELCVILIQTQGDCPRGYASRRESRDCAQV